MGKCVINNKNLCYGEYYFSILVNINKIPYFPLVLFYRNGKEFGFLFGGDLSKTERLACSYDYHIGSISNGFYGILEISMVWKFAPLKNCECEDLFK